MMGSGGMIVMDDRTCMVDVGPLLRGLPLRRVVRQVHALPRGAREPARDAATRICDGKGEPRRTSSCSRTSAPCSRAARSAASARARPTRCCRRCATSAPSTRRTSCERQAARRACARRSSSSPSTTQCNGCTLCVKPCPTDAITGTLKQPHVIDQDEVHPVRHLRGRLQVRRDHRCE